MEEIMEAVRSCDLGNTQFVPQSGSSIRPGGYPAGEELLTEEVSE